MVSASDAELERVDAEVSVHVARHADHQGGPLGDGAGELLLCFFSLRLFLFLSCSRFSFPPIVPRFVFPLISSRGLVRNSVRGPFYGRASFTK